MRGRSTHPTGTTVRRTRPRRRRSVLTFVALSVLAAACGSESTASQDGPAPTDGAQEQGAPASTSPPAAPSDPGSAAGADSSDSDLPPVKVGAILSTSGIYSQLGFDGLTVRCEVLECTPPSRLVITWSAGPPVENTHVSFRLEPDPAGTRLFFEHAGIDLAHPNGEHAFKGADYGWARMLKQLDTLLKSPARERQS